MAKEGLGNYFDVSTGSAPSDWGTAVTGNRVSLRNAAGVSILVVKEAGAVGEDPDFTLQEHTAASGGTSRDLEVVDHYYVKSETSLDGDETWTRVDQTASATVAASDTSAEAQEVYVIEVNADSLSDDCEFVSLNVADVGTTGGQYGAVLYILHGLQVKRAPANLANPQS